MTTRIFKENRGSRKSPREVLRGMGRILDISGSYSIDVRIKYLAADSLAIDADSLRTDWEKIGGDMRSSIARMREKHGEEKE